MALVVTKNTVFAAKYTTQTLNNGPTTILFNTRGDYTSTPPTVQRSTTSNPNWRIQIAKGENAASPYLIQSVKVRAARVACSDITVFPNGAVYRNTNREVIAVACPPVTPGYNHDPTRDLAIARLRRSLQNRVGRFSSIPAIVEAKEMRGLIGKAADLTSDVMKSLIDLKRGRYRDVARRASDLWLTYSFGIKPTIGDIADATESLSSFLTRQGYRQRFLGSASRTDLAQQTTSTITGTGRSDIRAVARAKRELSYRFLAIVDFSTFAGNDYSLAQHFGLTPYDLPSAAWELTAFSWVADYFGTVGDYLEDTFYQPPGRIISVVESVKYSVDGGTEYTHFPGSSMTSIMSNMTGYSPYRYSEFRRQTGLTLPVRSLRFKTRDEIAKNALSKLFNLGSILLK